MDTDTFMNMNLIQTDELSKAIPFIKDKGYTVKSLLRKSKSSLTYQVIGETDSTFYILKVRSLDDYTHIANEADMLKLLNENSIDAPKLVDYGKTDNASYLIREYIKGETLSEYADRVGIIREDELIDIGIGLLKQLEKLQNLRTQIIHRDIKPENIIIVNDRKTTEYMLIDYDTARTYKEGATSDTMFMGTLSTAAPEQFGFTQSDIRTDIYGVGKTLIYLACGSYDEENLKTTDYSKRLKSLLLKSISVDKRFRPRSAKDMIKMLLDIRRVSNVKSKLFSVPAFLAAIFICSVIAFAIGYYLADNKSHTPVNNNIAEDNKHIPYVSSDPEYVYFEGSKSMENAVRTALNIKNSDEPITFDELKNIRMIFIVGMDAYTEYSKYQYIEWQDEFVKLDENKMDVCFYPEVSEGDINDLSLIKYMPNLKKLFIGHQLVKDISPIKDIPLERLSIVDCPVSDLSAINTLDNLHSLVIADCPVTDLSGISDLKRLDYLSLNILNLKTLKDIPKSRCDYLRIDGVNVDDMSYGEIGKINNLSYLELFNVDGDAINSLGDMKYLETLCLGRITMKNGFLDSGYMNNVSNLQLYNCTFATVRGLMEHFPSLKTITCKEYQRNQIMRECPKNNYEWEELPE